MPDLCSGFVVSPESQAIFVCLHVGESAFMWCHCDVTFDVPHTFLKFLNLIYNVFMSLLWHSQRPGRVLPHKVTPRDVLLLQWLAKKGHKGSNIRRGFANRKMNTWLHSDFLYLLSCTSAIIRIFLPLRQKQNKTKQKQLRRFLGLITY